MSEHPQSKNALITGANKGIGYEIARTLGQRGVTVLLGCRDKTLGAKAVRRLQCEGIQADVVQLDVTDLQSIRSAAAYLESHFGRLDILVNNAGANQEVGVAGMRPSLTDLSVVRRTYEVNVFGVIAMMQGMLPLLLKSKAARIVNMSSHLGSLSEASSLNRDARPLFLGYCSSKSALNSITVQFANELRDTPIKVNAACPGFCATDMNGNRGSRSAREGALVPVRLAMLADNGPTGSLFDEQGVVPW